MSRRRDCITLAAGGTVLLLDPALVVVSLPLGGFAKDRCPRRSSKCGGSVVART